MWILVNLYATAELFGLLPSPKRQDGDSDGTDEEMGNEDVVSLDSWGSDLTDTAADGMWVGLCVAYGAYCLAQTRFASMECLLYLIEKVFDLTHASHTHRTRVCNTRRGIYNIL